MKIIPSLLICVCSFISLSILAQIPCDDTPPYFYDQAEVIYDTATLHTYCLDMRPPYPAAGTPWPGCPTVSFHNPGWLIFALPYDSITFEIRITDCTNNQGAQFSIYELPNDIQYDPSNPDGIQPTADMLLTSCQWTEMPHLDTIMFGLKTTAGQHYGLISDGWNGDQCKVEIHMERANEVMSGHPEFQLTPYGTSTELQVMGEHRYTATKWQIWEDGEFVDLEFSRAFHGVDTDTLQIQNMYFDEPQKFRYILGENDAYISDTLMVQPFHDQVLKPD